MSYFGDVFNFEKFNLKDMWGKVKKHPDQLITGVDPASTTLWNKVLGRKYEPIVDQMGGAYGGHWLSAFGNKDGGVYQRAADAGVDTKAGGQMQDAAHIIAALFAGNYGLDKFNAGSQNGGLLGGDSQGFDMNQLSQLMPQQKQQEQQQLIQPQPYQFQPYQPQQTVYQPISIRGLLG